MKASTKVITTFGKTGYGLYGKSFIETFLSYWPDNIKLTVYKEDWQESESNPRIEYLDIDEKIPEVNKFRDHCSRQIADLEKQDRNSKRINWYNKAIRWSFKSLVIWRELKRKDSRYVIWLDGDVSTLKAPKEDIAELLLKGQAFASQMEHVKGMPHCETGIAVFDTAHEQCSRIVDMLGEGYIDNRVLGLEKPWDGFWFAEMVKRGISFTDMNKDRSGAGKTFTNRYIFKVLDHNVGNKKLKTNGLHAITGRQIDESW